MDDRPATGSGRGATCPPEIVEAMGFEPTEEQWRAISMPLEPYVIVAGAGSGKTSVIAARIVYLALAALERIPGVQEGVLPGNVLCLTFTNKATENLVLRVRRALRPLDLPEGHEPAILNYHALAAELVERHGLLIGVEPGHRVLTPAQRTELCARVLGELAFEHVNAEWQPSLVEAILALADQAANHRVEPERIVELNRQRLEELRSYRSEAPYRAALERIELAEAVGRFRDLKRELGVIDFGDQITLALEIAERYPEVGQEYRSRYEAVVLDEYQDTNVAQADLLAALFGGGFPIAGVGDPDQNIYAWRGASLYNLLQFPERFPAGNGARARTLPLYTNFRSGSRILEAADRIISPLPEAQRPDPRKELRPWPGNGQGEVELARFADEWAEARWIAERIRRWHDDDPGGGRWRDFAVLCRKSRLFTPLQQAMGDAGVPAEFVGLTGLIRAPEVVEVLAYARAVADPQASVSLARILLGPRYRIGYKDLALVAGWAKQRNYDLRAEDEKEPGPYLFAEALEHLDEVEGLSEEGRARLEEFCHELGELRAHAGRPVGEFLAEVIRRTGLLGELDASLDQEGARARKRNLAAFLEEVHGFSPLDGELTLRSFLDYVETVEGVERQEWSAVQPSDEDSVKVMTIHQAKGLEFDTVFVPGMAHELLPDVRVQHNPAERGKSLDFELRGDRAILPSLEGSGGVLRRFWGRLRDQQLVEERRTCYVALTRARRRLVCTGAHWYGEGDAPKRPSVFFDELAEWGEQEARARVDRGPEVPEANPLLGYRERFVRDWPGPAAAGEGDELFPRGWRRAAAEASRRGGLQPELIEVLGPDERAEFERLAGERRLVARHLAERERAGEAGPAEAVPAAVSVGSVIDYARCPKRFYWSVVRPLPRFSGPAARIGTQVHAWIERQSSGQATLLELDEAPDLTVEELAGEPGRVERLQRAFSRSRFASMVPLHAERPFLLPVGGFVVSGRIDAIFGTPGGRWEVVDYKTGRRPERDDPLAGLQLDLYALACTEVWGKRPQDVTLTYFYLASGEEDVRQADDPEATRRRVASSLAGVAAGRFDPTPGPQCRWCDFLPFCDPGRERVEATAGRD